MERLQGLNLRDGELSKPWPGPGPHLTPGAARSWTCSRCAALHLAWETAHIWGDQLASEEAQTPTNYLNKLENAAEPTPSGQCVTHTSGHCGSHVVRNYHLTGTAARCPKTELQTRAEQQRQTWSCSCSAILCHHTQPEHSWTDYIQCVPLPRASRTVPEGNATSYQSLWGQPPWHCSQPLGS